MEPYYDSDGITIYHGDCRSILPLLEPVDVVLTDPPYPKLKGNLRSDMGGGVVTRTKQHKTVGLPWGDDLSPVRDACRLATKGSLVFCSFHSVALVPDLVGDDPVALVTWFKRNSMPPVRNVPHYQTEFIWAFSKPSSGLEWRKLKTHYDIPLLQAGCMAKERIRKLDGSTAHDAQKPIKLISALLAVGGTTILDPYVGSGTTLEAAKLLGRTAIGIEIDERYCEIAANRLLQKVLQFSD